jgi:hypothetical protein
MGTSSSYGGPKGKNPLLPNDFDDNETPSDNPAAQHIQPSEDTEKNPNTILWQNAKTQISKLIKNSNRNTISALSSYVKAHGGTNSAASSATSGRMTTVKLGRVLSSISSQGIQNTLKQFKIEFMGRSVDEVLGDLINKIAPTPNTKEDTVARNALLDALEILYEEVDENNDDINFLDNLDEEKFNAVMNKYIASYIFQRFLNDLESRFEEYAQNEGSALNIENEIKEYISGVVDNELKDQNMSLLDYTSETVMEIINKIYTDCYSVIEGVL